MQNYFHQIKPKSTFINAIRARYWKAVSDRMLIEFLLVLLFFFFFFFLSIFERYIARAIKNGKGEKRKIELWNTINQ